MRSSEDQAENAGRHPTPSTPLYRSKRNSADIDVRVGEIGGAQTRQVQMRIRWQHGIQRRPLLVVGSSHLLHTCLRLMMAASRPSSEGGSRKPKCRGFMALPATALIYTKDWRRLAGRVQTGGDQVGRGCHHVASCNLRLQLRCNGVATRQRATTLCPHAWAGHAQEQCDALGPDARGRRGVRQGRARQGQGDQRDTCMLQEVGFNSVAMQ